MTLRYFRGRVDLDRLPLADMARVTGALAVLEELARDGNLTFEHGVSRRAGPRPDRAGKPVVEKRPKLQEEIVSCLADGGRMNFWQIAEVTGIGPNSLSPNLHALTTQGVITREASRSAGEVGRARRENIFYELAAEAERSGYLGAGETEERETGDRNA